MFKYIRSESGQSMVLVVLMIFVLLGFGALAVDVGAMTYQKGLMQNAADAAALAGVQYLPNHNTAKTQAEKYVKEKNGLPTDTVVVNTPYIDPVTNIEDKTKVEVIITRTFDNYLAQALSPAFADNTFTVRAVAQGTSVWSGQALPFLNMESFGEYGEMNIWTKIGENLDGLTGYFESLDKSEIEYTDGSFIVKFPDGIEVDPGKIANGPHKIKDNLEIMWNVYKEMEPDDRIIFCFSLAPKVFQRTSPKYVLVEPSDKENKRYLEGTKNKLKNGDNIRFDELVLLECKWLDYSLKDMKLELEFTGKVYDLGNTVAESEDYTVISGVPTGQFGMSQVGAIKLVE